jgi:hypothetical protein
LKPILAISFSFSIILDSIFLPQANFTRGKLAASHYNIIGTNPSSADEQGSFLKESLLRQLSTVFLGI